MFAWMPLKFTSDRVPAKNIRSLAGRPLYRWALDTARHLLWSMELSSIYVWSSRLPPSLPEDVVWVPRSPALDDRRVSAEEFYRHARHDLANVAQQGRSDSGLLFHATSPFLSVQTLRALIEAVKSRQHDSALTCKQIRTMCWLGDRPLNHHGHWPAKTQDMQPLVASTTGAAAFRWDLLDLGRFIGLHPLLFPVSAIEAIDIDYPDDWDLAEAVAKGGTFDGGDSSLRP